MAVKIGSARGKQCLCLGIVAAVQEQIQVAHHGAHQRRLVDEQD